MEMGLVSSTLLGKMDGRYRSVIDKDEWKRRDFERCVILTVEISIRYINELLSY